MFVVNVELICVCGGRGRVQLHWFAFFRLMHHCKNYPLPHWSLCPLARGHETLDTQFCFLVLIWVPCIVLWWFAWGMPTIDSSVWLVGPSAVGKVMEFIGCWALLQEVCHWKWLVEFVALPFTFSFLCVADSVSASLLLWLSATLSVSPSWSKITKVDEWCGRWSGNQWSQSEIDQELESRENNSTVFTSCRAARVAVGPEI